MILRSSPRLKFLLKRCAEVVTGRRVQYHVLPHSKEGILFTFDDGPLLATPPILGVLRELRIKAMFFVIAGNVEAYPDIARSIVDEGHAIGLHGLTHVDMSTLTLAEFSRQIREGSRILKDVCGIEVRYFRPPFGRIRFVQAVWLLVHGFILIFWSCGVSESGDFDFINPLIQKGEMGKMRRYRLVVLLHDHISLRVVKDSLTRLHHPDSL